MTENDILKYFTAEKTESLIFVIIGLLAVIVACYVRFSFRTDFYKGLFYSLVIIAMIQIFVGGTVFFRSPGDIARVTSYLQNDPEKLETEEMPRMALVNKNFVIYRYVEIALALVGLFFCFSFNKHSFWFGIGLGLTIQASILLVADYFAERRALEYTELLKNFIDYKITS